MRGDDSHTDGRQAGAVNIGMNNATYLDLGLGASSDAMTEPNKGAAKIADNPPAEMMMPNDGPRLAPTNSESAESVYSGRALEG